MFPHSLPIRSLSYICCAAVFPFLYFLRLPIPSPISPARDPDPPRGSARVARPALGLWVVAAAVERSGYPPYRSCESPRGSGPPRAAALREQRPRGATAYPHGATFPLPDDNSAESTEMRDDEIMGGQ